MSDEPDEKKSAERLAACIKAVVEQLDRPDFPPDSAADHFGVSFAYGADSVGLLDRAGHLLVAIYRCQWPDPIVSRTKCLHCGHVDVVRQAAETGWPKSTHEARRDAVAAILGSSVIDQWNGNDKTSGISFVLARAAPVSLSTAMRRRAEGYTLGRRAFSQWLSSTPLPVQVSGQRLERR